MTDMEELYILEKIGAFLRERPGFICPEDVAEMTSALGVSGEFAYAALLAAGCGVDGEDARGREMLSDIASMVRKLDPEVYRNDPYWRTFRLPEVRRSAFRLGYEQYAPCEAVVCGELFRGRSGRLLTPIGYFTEPFRYPALLEGDALWMSVSPNEVETMRAPIRRARGKALALGLGMGYYAFRIAEKPEVSSVTVVAREEDVIGLFREYLLPQMPNGHKIHIVHADAFEYMQDTAPSVGFDHVFCDLWHDAGDGLPMYRRLKAMESAFSGTVFDYWIEPSMRLYMEAGF